MAYRKRIYYTDNQKARMWGRWQQGKTLSRLKRASSTIGREVNCNGGLRQAGVYR
jgi:hypothetical protein